MPPHCRPATMDDLSDIVALLHQAARARQAEDPILWALEADPEAAIATATAASLTAERHLWTVAEAKGRVTGAMHAMLLGVPPIYAGNWGDPGLILHDSALAAEATPGTAEALLAATETRLRAAGARLLVAADTPAGPWGPLLARRGYAELTLYLARGDLGAEGSPPGVRAATGADVPGIVRRSAEHRRILEEIDPFWARHPDADPRFSAWMERSLTLADRDMRVAGPPEAIAGYVIAQPATRLHFPAGHAIVGIGVIDDLHHADLANTATLADAGRGTRALVQAAEAAFAARGTGAALVVCPARWRSKVACLEAAGYRVALVWSIQREGAQRDDGASGG